MPISSEFLLKQPSYRSILRNEFESRKARRPSYSIRAFARDLDLKATTLSGVMNNRHGISAKLARGVATRLNFNEEQSDIFIDMVESEHARTKIARFEAQLRLKKRLKSAEFSSLSDSSLDLLSSWHYPAVLELIANGRHLKTVEQISEALGLSIEECKTSLEKLQRFGVIRKTERGYVREKKYLSRVSSTPNSTVRSFHKQILDLGKGAIERSPIEERKFLSTIFSFEKSKLVEARAWLEKMHFAFIDEFGTSDESDSVYSIGVQLFRIDRDGPT